MTPSHRLAPAALLALGLLVPSSVRGATCRDRPPQGWEIRIASRDERGRRLVISGRVLDRDRRPLPGTTVYVYHADAGGLYNRIGSEASEPRLCGVLRTNARGEYRVHTVMPGGYSGASPHVHFEVWGARVALQPLVLELRSDGSERESRGRVPVFRGPWPKMRDNTAATERRAVAGTDGTLRRTRDLVVATRGGR